MKRTTAVLAALATLVALTGLPTAGAIAASSSSIQPIGLTVEHLASPLGIDQAHPLLGWKLDSDANGSVQSAYEIEVATDAAFAHDVWDSGTVSSSTPADIAYAGNALVSQTEYHWRVRVKDADANLSAWSAPATFETSFINQADFAGDWIGSPNRMPTTTLAGSNWIWYPEGSPATSAPSGSRYLRKDFTIPTGASITSAQVLMTADDYFTLYVNGTLAVASPTSGEAWRTIRVTDISAYLHPGANTLAVVAQNAGAGAAGVIGRLHIVTASGDPIDITTDASWVASNTLQTGWQATTFDDSAWPAAKIGAAWGSGPWGTAASAPVPPEPLLRRDFAVTKQVASARVYVAGLGYYKLYLDGTRVGNHELDPGFTDYDDTVLYSTYDVTDAIKSGANTVGVSLGRGYFGELQPDEWVSSVWHDDPKLKLELQITYTDGSVSRVVSGTDWSAGDGPTTSDSVWLGENYDARLDQAGWNAPGFDASSWRSAVQTSNPGGALRSQLFPAIQVTDDLPVVATTHPTSTAAVYDVGEPTAGWAKVAMSGPAGAQVKMIYGEKLRDDGTVNNDDVFYTVQTYNYTLKGGGTEVYQPSYSYAGFRYVQITAPAGVTISSVTGERVHTAVSRVGDFSSSSDLLDKYNDAQANTILNNLYSVPTDTPMYEKRPYTADAFLSADSAIDLFDMQNFYESWMRTHRDDQSPDGTFGNTVPGTAGGKATTDPVWSSSYIAIDWDLYQYYGNTRVLADNYVGLKKWMDYYDTNIASTGGVYTGFSYGDWLSPEGSNAPEGTRLTATAYLYRGATQLAKIATALGHTADATHYEQLASTIYTTFNTTFYHAASGTYVDNAAAGYRQTSNLLPLSFGLVPAANKATVLGHLVDDITTRGNHLDTGSIGTKELLPVLTQNGYADLAYKVATNPTYPGWGYWFTALDATTMWEQWDADSRSHDHDFLGTVVDWMYQDVAGITPEAPGYTKVKIQPYPITGLDHAQAHVSSPFGDIASSWVRTADSYTLDVTVPVGSTADVYVPVASGETVTASPQSTSAGSPVADGFQKFSVGSGEYHFVAAAPPADTAAPSVAIDVAPAANANGWQNSATSVSISASDDGSGVAGVEYRVGGGDWAPYSGPLVLDSGVTTVEAKATDVAGNVSDIVSRAVKVDRDAPVSSAAVDERARTVSLRGADALSGLDRIEYNLGQGWITYSSPIVVGGAETQVDYRAIDLAGNVETASSAVVPRVGVALQPSLVAGPSSVGTHAYGTKGTVAVKVVGSGGIASGTVSVLNGAVQVGLGRLDAAGRATIAISGTALTVGKHSLTLVYSGDARFASSTDTITATIAKLKPTVKVIAGHSSYKRTQSPTITVRVSPTKYVDGIVTVKLGSKVLKSHVRVVKGSAKIRLKPIAARGAHRFTVIYSGGHHTTRVVTSVGAVIRVK